MKLSQLALVVALAAVTSFGVVKVVGSGANGVAQDTKKETAFERVMRTGTLRCGYVLHAPFVIKDLETGAYSGLIIDMMNYFTRKTGIKVELTEEVNFGNWVMALQSGRIDGVCTTIWPDVSFTRVAKFSKPFFYLDMVPVVRADETRFGPDIQDFNSEAITIGVLEGDSTETVGRATFSKAKFVGMAPNTDLGTLFQNLLDKKFDMVQEDRNSVYQFSQKNPGKIKALDVSEPIKIIPSEFVVGVNETALIDMLDGLVDDLLNNGEMNRILDRWQPTPGIFLRVAKPYVPETMDMVAPRNVAATPEATPVTDEAKP
ncbi:MAG: transporter substrate-binding domain-containing protein [Alphaproteobacteria bacterium]|nr:transporter substrate-binding domain-containing protein [Alphaproteobacteria bacterium]